MEDDFSRQAVKVFKALGDLNSYSILKLFIQKGELPCADFDGQFKLSRPAMPHHQRIPENVGLIDVRKEGVDFYMKVNVDIVNKFTPGFVTVLTK